jgi:hypothetical protein
MPILKELGTQEFYSVHLIRQLMAGYAMLEAGQNPLDAGLPEGIDRGSIRHNERMAEIYKTDIDNAIQSLRSPRLKMIVTLADIYEKDLHELEYWLDIPKGSAKDLEEMAIKLMTLHLNGKVKVNRYKWRQSKRYQDRKLAHKNN